MRGINRLSTKQVESFRSKAAVGQKQFDGAGLFIVKTSTSGVSWRLKYRHGGNERTYSMGNVSLKDARDERDRVKDLLEAGHDPVKARVVAKANNVAASDMTFELVANEWLAKRKAEWVEKHYKNARLIIVNDLLPTLGQMPIRDVTAKAIADAIEAMLKRNVRPSAVRAYRYCNGIIRLAQANGYVSSNVAQAVIEVLPKAGAVKRHPAFLDFANLRNVLAIGDAANVSPAVRQALRLVAFTAVRIENAASAEWSEFDLGDLPEWRIPRAKMKSKDREFDHVIPLSPTIAQELRRWKAMTNGSRYVFPSPYEGKVPHIGSPALTKAFRVTLGFEGKMTPHGWRASFATLSRDPHVGKFEREVVELSLDHIADTDVARAYDRGPKMGRRRELFAWWDSQLCPPPAGTLPFSRGKAS